MRRARKLRVCLQFLKTMIRHKKPVLRITAVCAAVMILLGISDLLVTHAYRIVYSDVAYSAWVADFLYYLNDFLCVALRTAGYSAIIYCSEIYKMRGAVWSSLAASCALLVVSAVFVLADLGRASNISALVQISAINYCFDFLFIVIAFMITCLSEKKESADISPETRSTKRGKSRYTVFIIIYMIIHAVVRTVEFIGDLIEYDFDITIREALNVAGSYVYIVCLYGVFAWLCGALFRKLYAKVCRNAP